MAPRDPSRTDDTEVDDPGDWRSEESVRELDGDPAYAGRQLVAKEPSDEKPGFVLLDEPTSSRRPERYEVRRTLGVGGMGEIVLVRDSIVGRDVALKRLRGSAKLNPRARSRFDHEARLQGQLEHPAIVPVYDIGERPDNTPYFTMKRVRGDTLQEILERILQDDAETKQRYSRRRLLSALSQVALAAHYAHERGVVHRDIKPGNIMLGHYGEVYLLDWGIAKVFGTRAPTPSLEDIPPPSGQSFVAPGGQSGHTMSGSILGTLRTMSPEQAMGVDLDGRADVYALGAILFEMLTLRTLHGRGTEYEVLWRIIEGVDARPSVRAPEIEVPPELEEIVVAATKRNPRERIQSARLLHDAIERYLDGDRDLEVRRNASQVHATMARIELDRVLNGERTHDADADWNDERTRRVKALREVGKALALDPENKGALRTLVGLLTNPPRHVPPEVHADRAAMWQRQIRLGGIAGTLVYGYISLNALFTLALGVQNFSVFWAAHALWGGALIASIVTTFRPSYASLFVMFLFGTGASLWVTGVYSPHLMVPSFITMHAALFALVRHWQLRMVMLAVAVLAWTVSVFGELYGLFPDTVQFVNGGIYIKSPVIDFPETLTTLYLFAAVLQMILFPALVIGSLRRSYHQADERLRLQSWQLHQLVPDEAAEASRKESIVPPPKARGSDPKPVTEQKD